MTEAQLTDMERASLERARANAQRADLAIDEFYDLESGAFKFWRVESEKSPNVWYNVRLFAGRLLCNCPAMNPPTDAMGLPVWEPKLTCKHAQAVHLAIQAGILKRPGH